MITQTLDFMRDAAVTEPAQTLNVMALLESLQHDYHDAGQEFKIRGGVARPVSGRPRALRRFGGTAQTSARSYLCTDRRAL